MGSAANSSATSRLTGSSPSSHANSSTHAGMHSSLMALVAITPRSIRSSAMGLSATPTATSPSGSAARPSNVTVSSLQPGRPTPLRFSPIPAKQAKISGFFASASALLPRLARPSVPAATKLATHITFTTGTISATATAAVVAPNEPCSAAAPATPT